MVYGSEYRALCKNATNWQKIVTLLFHVAKHFHAWMLPANILQRCNVQNIKQNTFVLSLYFYVYRSWIGSWTNSLSCAPNCELHPLIRPIQNPPQPGAWPFSAACRPSRPVHSGVSIITAPVMGHVKIHTGSPVKPNGRPTANQTGWTL